jgi:energy-coupling factor transporter ATP-binding protein EcfA2
MSKREAPQTRQKRTRPVSVGTPRGSSLRAATVRRKLDAREQLAPVELLIENVRCFAGRHVIPIRPLTVLVGENSSGKSTLLAALSIVSDSRFPFSPEFNQPPFSLGNFQTIATYKGPKEGHSPTFSLGFTSWGGELPRDVTATYIWDHRRTSISELLVERHKGLASLRLLPSADKYEIEVIPAPTAKWASEKFQIPVGELTVSRPRDLSELYLGGFDEFGDLALLAAKRIDLAFSNLSLTSAISIAPIRTKPARTYDEVAEDFSPEGRHIPFVLARILSGGTDAKGKAKLLKGLKRFGEQSGLFKDIEIRDLGDQPGDPFQVMVTVEGRPANLLDVGYGVSQALPVVVQSILAAEGDLLLIQQPEVHLHPMAQAALGSFFVDMVGDHDKRFVVETHSDYILDRIRMEIADGKLPSEAFLILYLERKGTETTVYPITVDSLGNLLGVPPTYREFFLHEAVNLLSRGE